MQLAATLFDYAIFLPANLSGQPSLIVIFERLNQGGEQCYLRSLLLRSSWIEIKALNGETEGYH